MDNDLISSSYTRTFPHFFDDDNLSAWFLDLWFQLIFFFYKLILTSTLHLGYCNLTFKKRVVKINKSYQNDKKKSWLTCDLYYDHNIISCDIDLLWPELAANSWPGHIYALENKPMHLCNKNIVNETWFCDVFTTIKQYFLFFDQTVFHEFVLLFFIYIMHV